MLRVSEQLGLVTSMTIANVWVFRPTSDAAYLIDTGFALERPLLHRALTRAGVGPGDIKAILLTHRHSDHAGNAAWLRGWLRCPVVCHADDAPFLTGDRTPQRLLARPNVPRWARLLCWFEDRAPARSPVDDTFVEGGWNDGFEIVSVAGHTEGSSLLFHESSGVLFCGDAILAGVAALRLREYVHLAVPEFSADVDGCRARVRGFVQRGQRVTALCSGHGPPVVRDVGRKLRKLAEP